MLEFLTLLPTLFAQEAGQAAGNQQGDNGMMTMIIMVAATLFIMWFLIMRPQQKQESRRQQMLAALDRNDKVMTVGGVIATVYSVDKEKKEVVLKVDESSGTKMRFSLSAITHVFDSKEGKKSEKSDK